MIRYFFFFFFFQAEDGIRDHCVTGVQTCALPILSARPILIAPEYPGLGISVRTMRRGAAWIAIVGGVLAGGIALDAVGLPSSYLFAALLLGLVIALALPDRVVLPAVSFRAAQAVAGVSLGAYLQEDALRAV